MSEKKHAEARSDDPYQGRVYAVFSEGTSRIDINPDETATEHNIRAMAGLLHHGFAPLSEAVDMANDLRDRGIRAFVAELKCIPEGPWAAN